MSYTNVAKPTDPNYTWVTFQGYRIWDDPNIFYDDPNVFWDGNSVALAYTNVAKPAELLGQYFWDEMAMSWQNAGESWGNPYINVNKPT